MQPIGAGVSGKSGASLSAELKTHFPWYTSARADNLKQASKPAVSSAWFRSSEPAAHGEKQRHGAGYCPAGDVAGMDEVARFLHCAARPPIEQKGTPNELASVWDCAYPGEC